MTNYIVGEDVFAELNSENINKSYIFNTKKTDRKLYNLGRP